MKRKRRALLIEQSRVQRYERIPSKKDWLIPVIPLTCMNEKGVRAWLTVHILD